MEALDSVNMRPARCPKWGSTCSVNAVSVATLRTMPNLNKVMLIGNLTRDPEIKYTPKGTAIAAFGLAINRNYTTEGGEKREEVTFVNLEAFARLAEVIGEYCKKGDPIFIEGRLKLDTWEKDGQKRSAMKVIVEGIQFLGGRREDSHADPERSQSSRPTNAPPPQRRAPVTPPRPPADPDLDAEPEDLPF